ncbi:MAG: hypothetical protein ACXVYB_11975 [Arthrobacter sp.]
MRGTLAGGATGKTKGLANDFTKLVIAGHTDQAYDGFLDPALRDKLSREDFTAGVISLKLDSSCVPAYNDVDVKSENGTSTADVAGVITCGGKAVELAYRFRGDDEPKMTTIRLKPKE